MRQVWMAMAAVAMAGCAATAFAGQAEKPKEVHGTGCVQAGVEARCLVVKDVKSGRLYNLMFKEPRPTIGEGIEFTGEPFDGVTVCMQGAPVKVTEWKRDESLKCSEGEAPGK